MHVVLLEWDGKKPPTTWYNRLEKLGLCVRGDKELSPVARRTPAWMESGKEMVIFQESCIVSASESLAKTLAHMAMGMGAQVQFLSASTVEMNMTKRDAEIMQRIEGTLGRRGRPSGEKTTWAVTCYEECCTHRQEEALYVTACPSCSSMAFYATQGEVPKYRMPDGDIVAVWMQHRFARGVFEVPYVDEFSPHPPSVVSISKPDEQMTINNMKKNGLLDEIRIVEKIAGRESALKLLDAVFCARTYVPEKVRKEARMRACLAVMERSASAVVNLREHPTDYDLLDAAHIDPIKIALLWLNVFGQKNGVAIP